VAKVLPLLYQQAVNGIKYSSWQQKLQNWWATENSGRFFCQFVAAQQTNIAAGSIKKNLPQISQITQKRKQSSAESAKSALIPA
jgi:hypothetical protein